MNMHGNAGMIQYDDGHWEYQNPPLGGQAVRFTVPLEYGPVWNLEILTIQTIGGPGEGKPIVVKVWDDNAGSMGQVLFELTSWVSGNMWHWYDFDLSAGNLQFSTGDSFFAGFDQDTQLWGCWDSTDPDHGRGYRRWIGDASWESVADDAMIRASGTTVSVPAPGAFVLGVLGLAMVTALLKGK